MYDVTDRKSFESLEDWLYEMLQCSSLNPDDVAVMICANKVTQSTMSDLFYAKQNDLSQHSVDASEGRLFADSKGFLFYETSAKTGHNVTSMFEVS